MRVACLVVRRNFVLDRQVQTVKDRSALIGLISDFTDL